MNKNALKNIFIIVTVIVAVIFLWLGYSLVRFSGFFSPFYIADLSDPFVYYQKHIGKMLIENGKEYEINDINTLDWKICKNENFGFEFKYPKDFYLSMLNNGRHVEFININNDKKCKLEIENNGWEIGKNWLPRKRKRIENEVEGKKYNELRYIEKNGDIFAISSAGFLNKNQAKNNYNNAQFTSVIFISHNGPFQFIKVSDYQHACSEDFIKGIFATFQFIK